MFTGFLVFFLANYIKFRSKVQAPRLRECNVAQLTVYRRANKEIDFIGAGKSINRSSNSGKINSPAFVCHTNLSRLILLKDYNDHVVYL